jgi:hypothetical protein
VPDPRNGEAVAARKKQVPGEIKQLFAFFAKP